MKKQDKKMASWQAMKQLLPIIGRYRLLLFISIILAAVSVISQLYVPIIFGRAIDQIVGPGKVDFPAIGQDLVQILILVIVSAAATWMMGLTVDLRGRTPAFLLTVAMTICDPVAAWAQP